MKDEDDFHIEKDIDPLDVVVLTSQTTNGKRNPLFSQCEEIIGLPLATQFWKMCSKIKKDHRTKEHPP